jgi:hypothetical protein
VNIYGIIKNYERSFVIITNQYSAEISLTNCGPV